jgi:hypothetical protein
VQNNACEEWEKRVSLFEPSELASLMRSSAWDVGSPCTTASEMHSQSSSTMPMMWKELTDHVAEARPRSGAVPLTKKPL